MSAISQETLERFAADCRKAAAYGLMQCSSGNLSRRLDDEQMLISATRSWMADLEANQVVLCRIDDGAILNDRKPSVEAAFHRGILQVRPKVNSVLHFQSPNATTLTCSELDGITFEVIPEIPFYIGPIGVVPYIQPGSPELAEAVIDIMQTHDLALLQNHGLVAAGNDVNDVIQKAAFFELACEIILRAGPRLRPLTPDTIQDLTAMGKGLQSGRV